MDKIVVQNLTGFGISFQGRIIAPYGSEEFLGITDYVALSKLFNANKVLYTTKTVQPKKVVFNTPSKETVKESVEEVSVKEAVEEPVTETVEVAETKETVDTVKPYEGLVNETKETKTSSKKNTKRNKDEK